MGVALNGEVKTVVPVFDVTSSSARFNAILPDDSFATGFNTLELFASGSLFLKPSTCSIAPSTGWSGDE